MVEKNTIRIEGRFVTYLKSEEREFDEIWHDIIDENFDSVEKVVDFLKDKGADFEPSASCFSEGMFYENEALWHNVKVILGVDEPYDPKQEGLLASGEKPHPYPYKDIHGYTRFSIHWATPEQEKDIYFALIPDGEICDM